MESTVSFGVLMELIQVVGAFVTAPIFFNLSVIHMLVIGFLFNMIIGLLLGGIEYRAHVVKNAPMVKVTPPSPNDLPNLDYNPNINWKNNW